MKIAIIGSTLNEDYNFVKWYLNILHASNPLTKLVFLTPSRKGVYRAAKEWAKFNKVGFLEYPNPQLFLENPEAVSYSLCFRETEDDLYKISYEIIHKLGITFLFAPSNNSKS